MDEAYCCDSLPLFPTTDPSTPLSVLQAQGFHGEIEDMQQWLKDTERQLLASKAVGGLPDTAREQLNAHLVRLLKNMKDGRADGKACRTHKCR